VKVHFTKAKGKDIEIVNMMPRLGAKLSMENNSKR